MANPCDREGRWRARPVRWGVKGSDSSQSLRVRILFALDEMWNVVTKEWEDWRQYEMEAWGSVVVVKKDGSEHHQGVESLALAFGWENGDLAFFADDSCSLPSCCITTQLDKYALGKGTRSYEMGWLNPYNAPDQSNTVGTMDAAQMEVARRRHMTQFRALCGNAKRNAVPPVPPAAPAVSDAPSSGDDIPF